MIGEAIKLAEAGHVVFPVSRTTKRPYVKYSALKADPEQARQMFEQFPGADLGLRTDAPLVVVDVDPAHGGAISPDWPATLTASTPSGGVHLYYTTGKFVKSSQSVVAPGVDVRGHNNGYVVAPPSPGREWIRDVPMAVMTDAMVKASRGLKPGQSYADKPRYSPPERFSSPRIPALLKYAGYLWRQCDSEDEWRELMHAVNEVDTDPPLDPAVLDSEVLDKIVRKEAAHDV